MTAIAIPNDLEAWARAEVAAGRAESVEALVADALRERRAETEWVGGQLDHARAAIARGESITGEDFLSDMDRRIARLRAQTKARE